MNKFRDSHGRWLTQALFPETAANDKHLTYRLKDGDTEVYKHLPSLKELYMDKMDTTEYLFANEYLGGWEHWQRLCDNAVIGRYIESWREELEVKVVALGLRQILNTARDTESKNHFQAAKLLADKGFKPKKSVGRPSKAEKEAEREFDAKLGNEVVADLDRIRGLQ